MVNISLNFANSLVSYSYNGFFLIIEYGSFIQSGSSRLGSLRIYFLFLLLGEFLSINYSMVTPFSAWSPWFLLSYFSLLTSTISSSPMLAITSKPVSIALTLSFLGLSTVLPINPPLDLGKSAIYLDDWQICISKFFKDASWFLFIVSCCLFTWSKLLCVAWMNFCRLSSSGEGFLWIGACWFCWIPRLLPVFWLLLHIKLGWSFHPRL